MTEGVKDTTCWVFTSAHYLRTEALSLSTVLPAVLDVCRSVGQPQVGLSV